LYYVPILHTGAELGGLEQDVRRRMGEEVFQQRQKVIDAAWDRVEMWAATLEPSLARCKLYQDGLPLCGIEEQIVRDLAARESRNHRLLLRLIERGATLLGTESPELLVSEYELAKAIVSPNADRKALEPVRNADVYLARLDSLRTTGNTSEDEKHLSPRCIREIDKLEDRLQRKRKAGIKELMDAIDARGKRLNRFSKELEAALAPHTPSNVHSTAPEALRIFAELTSEFPNLDAGNLHEYRKRLKQARYLVEISATADPLAKRLAAAFRRIHYSAGEWHDWQELARKAGRILPGHGEQDGLIPVLKELAAKALHRALGQCRSTEARFLKNVSNVRPFPLRKPVAADPGPQSEDTSLQAATR
jgi:CHAD domain-containing protein